METERLRATLENVGLTQYEADAYIAVLELGSAPATEVSDACDVPQARIYDVLRNLEKEGFIETYQEGSLHARAHEPAAILDTLTDHATTVSQAVDEIQDRWERPTVENHRVSVLKPLSSIYDRAREAIENAENELQIAVNRSQFDELRDSLEGAYDRGIVVKLTLTPDETDDRTSEPTFDESSFVGVATEVRYRRLHTPFLVIADGIRVCFAPEQPLHPSHEYGVLVNDYSLSRTFDWYFQTALWALWDVVYSDRDNALPATYTKIRECIQDITPLLADGAEVIMSVHGKDRNSGDDVTITGRVVDVAYDSGGGNDLRSYVEEATIDLETQDGVMTVGGWGALYEDIEGKRFVVETAH
ncbi:Sugar-specific transcriptional regulator TrmB [Halogranum rubrum]|uniref:Sugar-specific transcriptional regulator TrmB n=1 Tax=Halogranum rubrum TaxID=553466 RepID=A0A1I4GP68_9EURY|nr:TrmB family transcriptional regulator [Halogranum rubrum]SFL31872.1 Sugar-specific transcriptional regulator TrmB [Halogranum rubrum]